MWPPWGKSSSSRRLRNSGSPSSSSSSSVSNSIITRSEFRCPSFKDIQFLCTTPQEQQQQQQQGQGQGQDNLVHAQFHRPKASTVFHRVRTATSILRQWSPRNNSQHAAVDHGINSSPQPPAPEASTAFLPQQGDDPAASASPDRLESSNHSSVSSSISIPGSETTIVIYTTSLRVVRSTFDACNEVKLILSGFRVSIDERDVSMDPRFMQEIRSILSSPGGDTKLSLPRVFIGGRYVGGADELRHLHEIGELKSLVEGLRQAEGGVCDSCGGFRFILCDACNGSHKIYTDKPAAAAGFRSCAACNHNGLIRCPSCCPPSSSSSVSSTAVRLPA